MRAGAGVDAPYWERGRLSRIPSTVVPAEAGTHPPLPPAPWALPIIPITSITRITVQTLPLLDNPGIIELMFPETQTTAVVDAVPALADIVREKTQGGRLIVRFFLSTMEGEFEDARVHHRVDAAKQLVILQNNSSFSDVVRDETDNGDRIINFLFSVMMGKIEGANHHHRNEAGKQLARLDPGVASTLADRQTRTPGRAVGIATDAPFDTGAVGAPVGSLADIIGQETNDGRDLVRFLLDVMDGNRTEFTTDNRVDAARELIHRYADPTPCPPARYHGTDAHTGAVGADTVSAATPWKTPRKPEWKYFEYPEDQTYDFDSYGEEDYRRDRFGDKALVHIFGDDEAKSAANQAVLDYKVDQIEAQRAAVHSDDDTCQPYDPCPSCRVPDPPDDDSFGPHTYGYNALIYIYGDKAAARAGCMGAMDHREKQRLGLIAADGYSYLDDIEDSGPDPPERPPPKPRVLAYFGPPEDYD